MKQPSLPSQPNKFVLDMKTIRCGYCHKESGMETSKWSNREQCYICPSCKYFSRLME